MFKAYYQLTKPGIIYGNLITAAAGFLFACQWNIDFGLLLATLAGVTLVIASACVFNNYIDRDIDKLMSRTHERALATGKVPPRSALVYATTLGVIGFLALGLFVNIRVVLLGLIAIFVYVVLYGVTKRRSVHGTLVGSFAGAIPPVAGYVAVTNRFDTASLLLFIILVCWQMPHFYAIAIYRFNDYKNAKLPVLPVKYGMQATKLQILIYIFAFTFSSLLLTVYGYVGFSYFIVMVAIGFYWLYMGLDGLKISREKNWAKRMFLFSLVVNLTFAITLTLGPILP